MAESKEDLDLATSTENCASLLEVNGKITEDVAKKYEHMRLSPDESITANFLMIVPHLVQCIKEIFRDEKIPKVQSGLRGVPDETILNNIASEIQEAAKDKNLFRLLSEVCNILERLCLNNNDNRSTEDKIREWGRSAMVIAMLEFLEKFFQSSEAQRLHKRLYVFSVAIRDIMVNPAPFEGNFLSDFHNVALSLLTLAKFDPSQLVRFELQDSSNSSSSQGNDGLKYEKSEDTFSQLFWIRKESDDELRLEAIAHVHINGHIRSIGAFESVITLPASYSETIDRIPISALSVAVKREQDDSKNLRVTVSATQKEKISKALKYLENELGADVVDLSQTEITPSHLKMRSFAKAGTLVRLRLVHKWGSETLVLDSNDVGSFADSTAGGACVPDPEMAAFPVASDSTVGDRSTPYSSAELTRRHVHEQHGPYAINYYQTFLSGHICVAGQNTRLNMQLPAAEQRSVEAGPSAASHRSLTTGTDEHEV